MGNLRRGFVASWVVILGVILLVTVAACSTSSDVITDDSGGDDATTGPPTVVLIYDGSEMRLTANGCAADCTFANGEEFTLTVEIVVIPPSGYIGVQSVIDFGSDLTYDAAASFDEIVWPDCESAVALSTLIGSTLVNHGCLSGLTPPLPISTYAGNFVELSMTCSSGSSETDVRLLLSDDPDARFSGAAFMRSDMVTQTAPEVSDLTIICGD